MAVTVIGLSEFGIIDGDANEPVLQTILTAAKAYFEGAGVPEPVETDADYAQRAPTYELGVYQLATYWYDNRTGASADGNEVPLSVRGIINQLRLRPGVTP
jgi:uncharacterized phage protein (predicted DNA packaging)